MKESDVERLEEELTKLKAKMLLLGHGDYQDVCVEIGKMIEEGSKEKKHK